jgi:hypothetical protein
VWNSAPSCYNFKKQNDGTKHYVESLFAYISLCLPFWGKPTLEGSVTDNVIGLLIQVNNTKSYICEIVSYAEQFTDLKSGV